MYRALGIHPIADGVAGYMSAEAGPTSMPPWTPPISTSKASPKISIGKTGTHLADVLATIIDYAGQQRHHVPQKANMWVELTRCSSRPQR